MFLNIFKGSLLQIVGGLTSVIVGLSVVFSWIGDFRSVLQLDSRFAPVQFNTAISFVLMGLSFLLLNRTRLSRAMSGLTFLFALTTLSSYFFKIDLKIDQLFFQQDILTGTSHPGRMGPNTAVCFLLISAALFFGVDITAKKPQVIICGILAASSAIFGLIALLGYSQNFESAYGWGNMTRMALLTAIAILVLGSSISIYFWEIFQKQGGIMPGWSSPMIFVLGIIFTFLTFQAAIETERSSLQVLTDNAANHFSDLIESRISARGRSLEKAAKHLSSAVRVPVDFWYDDLAQRLDELPGFEAIGKTDVNGNIILIKKKTTISYSHINEIQEMADTVKDTMVQPNQSGFFHLTDPFTLKNGNPAFAMVVPAFRDKSVYDGVVFAIFDVQKLFDSIADKKTVLTDFNFSLSSDGSPLYMRDFNTDETSSDVVFQRNLTHGFQEWVLKVSPKTSFIEQGRYVLARQILAVGLLVSLLLGVLGHLIRLMTIKSRDATNLSISLQAILDGSTRVSILATDLLGTITIFNPGAEKMLGYSSAEVVNKKSALVFHTSEELSDHAQEVYFRTNQNPTPFEALTEIARGGAFEEKQWSYVKKDGSRIPVSLIITPIKHQKEIVGFLEIAVDVTETERKLRDYAQMLEKTNMELEEFSYVASHDLKEPVRNLVSYSKLLEEDLGKELSVDVADDLKFIVDAARRMETLVNDLLQLSRAGRSAMKVVDVTLENIITEVLEDLETRINESRAEIVVKDANIQLEADKTLISQLFSNLIVNAIKFVRPEVKPQIKISTVKVGDQITIQISDNGIGMKDEYLGQIFQPFKRLHGMNQYEGSGIGLSICKKIVERHNGTISVNSKLGNGTTFVVSLPVQQQ